MLQATQRSLLEAYENLAKNKRKEKRKLENLIIDFKKIPKFAESKSETDQLIKKINTAKKEITAQNEIILKKLDVSKISNFSKEIFRDDIQKTLKNDQILVSYFFTHHYLHILTISNRPHLNMFHCYNLSYCNYYRIR